MDFVEYLEGLDGLRCARRFVITVILLIQDYMARGELIYGQLIHRLIGGGRKTLFDRLEELERHGFITKRTIERSYPRTMALKLTENGQRVADILRQLRDIEF